MKSNLYAIMAMAAAMGPMPVYPDLAALERQRPRRTPPPPPTPERIKEQLLAAKELVDTGLEEYSSKRPKGQEFEVQGFTIKANNLKNAIKGVRKVLGEAGLQPELTLKKYELALLEINRRIDERKEVPTEQGPDTSGQE